VLRATHDGAVMQKIGTWIFYLVGAIAIGYLLLYVYAWLTAPELTPGEPIRIFRKQDAPDYG
jgi:hypothetical protein